MKVIIFLDIDGVVCTYKEFNRNRQKFWKKHEIANKLKIPYEFNPGCVKILNEILEKTDAEIVLSSDWRVHFKIEELDIIFKFNNVIKSPIDVTEVYPTSLSYMEKNRGGEIMRYLQKHRDITTYVIVDDMNIEQFVPEGHFIRTIGREGLNQTSIKEKILKILGYEQK